MLAFTFPDLLELNLHGRSQKSALVRGDEELSFEELDARSEGLAMRLASLGIAKGEPVCLHLPKSILETVATFALSRLGAVVTNVSAQLTERQLRHVLQHSGAEVLVTTPRVAHSLVEHGLPPALRHIVVDAPGPQSEPIHSLEGLEPVAVAWPRLIGSDPCAILYTSGSTGLPKGVLLSHDTVVQSARSAARHLSNEEGDRALSVLPLSFDFGLSQLTTMMTVGGTLVLPKAAMAAELVKTVEEQQVNAIAGVPTMWISLVRWLTRQERSLEGVGYVANSGGALPGDVRDAWPAVFPNARHYLMYGMTEGFRSSYLEPADFERKRGSIGKALPNVELYVVNDEQDLCGPGEQGQIIHRSDSIMSSGYYKDKEATDERIKPCAALRHLIGDEKVLFTGDTGYFDEDGYLFFVARTTTFIKCSDYRVSPTEVEDVILSTRLVSDAVAFGTPNEELGQVVNVAVASADQEVDVDALMRHCRSTMPSDMVPRAIHVWNEPTMPRTGSGKVDRPTVIESCLAK